MTFVYLSICFCHLEISYRFLYNQNTSIDAQPAILRSSPPPQEIFLFRLTNLSSARIFGGFLEGSGRTCLTPWWSIKWLPSAQDQSSAFKVKNTSLKDTNGERKSNRMLSFLLWRKESFASGNRTSRNSTLVSFYSVGHGMFWNATKAAKFLLNFQVHFVLYDRVNYVA